MIDPAMVRNVIFGGGAVAPTFGELIDADPLLRLHCAVDRDGTAHPPHPAGPTSIIDASSTAEALVFRVLLDRYGVLLPAASRLEILPDGRPGRIVLPDTTAGEADGPGARARLARITPEGAELGFLGPHAAALLGGGAHTVGSRQHEILTEVLRRVAERTRLRRGDPLRRRPAVMLDVDLCALDPEARTRHALTSLGFDPDRHPRLPTYHPPTWERWISETDARLDYDAFYRAFFQPWERMRWDRPARGLAAFAWQVHDAGGLVVFNTGRRERVRAHTEHALALAGIRAPRMAMLPDDRTRPVHELKAENVRSFADLDIVAVFDDLCENRQAMAKELPDALFVAVALPAHLAEPAYDGAEVIAGFETVPRSGLTSAGPAVSDTTSLAELPLGVLLPSAAAFSHAVRLTEKESGEIVQALLDGAERDAERTAATAAGLPGMVPRIWHLFTRPQFRKGPKALFPLDVAEHEMAGHVRDGAPIPVVTFGFPVKLPANELKTLGHLPDLAELGALIRLRELHRTVQRVYPPGIAVTVLTDGDHFSAMPAARLKAYGDHLAAYRDLIGGKEFLRLVDLEEFATDRYGPGIRERHRELVGHHIGELAGALGHLDVTADPVGALDRATEICAAVLGDRSDGTVMPPFGSLFSSRIYQVEMTPPRGVSRPDFARRVLSELFVLHGCDPVLAEGRRNALTDGWHSTIRYLSVLRADRDLAYDDTAFFTRRVRLTPNPRRGNLGFTFLGGSAVLPWQGTAAIDSRGRLSVDFAVSLLDQGFVPVHSPLLDSTQPWTMVPVTQIRNGTLDPAFRAAIRLRRR